MNAQFTKPEDVRQFLFAGHAIITLVSVRTGARFTYKVDMPKEPAKPLFVSLLTGPDNGADYRYLGYIQRHALYVLRGSTNSCATTTAPSWQAFAYLLQLLARRGPLPATLQVWHEGRCGRCARRLTVPASIARGIGPECAGVMEADKRMGQPHYEHDEREEPWHYT